MEVGFESRLLAGKARIFGADSTPRSEMNGLLLLCRLVTAVLPGLTDRMESITLVGDSQCTIASVESEHTILGPWFSNRVGEVREHMEDWGRLCPVNPLYHLPSDLNPADLVTRG